MIVPTPTSWAVDLLKVNIQKPEPCTMTPPSIAMTCHYRDKAQTDKAINSLLDTTPEVKKVIVVDTSIEQDYTNQDPRVKIINLPNGLHSDGVNFGLQHLYRTQMSRRDKRVLLMDSDVEFTAPIPLLPEGVLVGRIVDKRCRPEGTEDINKVWLSVLQRVHPCFCVIDYGFLHAHKIPFMDWTRITEDNKLILGHNPKADAMDNPKYPAIRAAQKSAWYDVGSTMYEDVVAAGGKISHFDWSGFMKHKIGGSWR